MTALSVKTHVKFTTTRNFTENAHSKFTIKSVLQSPAQVKFSTSQALVGRTHVKFTIRFLYAYQLVNQGHATFRIGNVPTVPDVITGIDGSAVFVQLIG